MLFYLFLLTLLTTLVCVFVLWYTIKKFYCGPSGRPPRYRYHEDDEPRRAAGRRAVKHGACAAATVRARRAPLLPSFASERGGRIDARRAQGRHEAGGERDRRERGGRRVLKKVRGRLKFPSFAIPGARRRSGDTLERH